MDVLNFLLLLLPVTTSLPETCHILYYGLRPLSQGRKEMLSCSSIMSAAAIECQACRACFKALMHSMTAVLHSMMGHDGHDPGHFSLLSCFPAYTAGTLAAKAALANFSIAYM